MRATSDPNFGGLDSHVDAEATAHGATDSITIPDAQLLFGGEYKRAGTDLTLSNHDHEFVVHDYFRNGNKPTLLSPDGGRVTADVVEALTGHGDYAQAGAPAQTAPTVVGRVVKFDGYVTVIRNGVAVSLHVGDGVLKGDVLQTGTGTMAVTFNDGSTLTLTENSRLAVNDFVYQANGTANSEILDLVRGSLSFVSGEVAHSGGHMNITTPVATMGIRGTVGTVSNQDDGTVHFSIVESATGAVLLDSKGNVFATITANGPDITVHFQNAQLVAQETQKSPQEIAQQQAILQNILSTQAVGQQILQQFFNQQPNPNPQSTDTQHTQINIDITKTVSDNGPPTGPVNTGNNTPPQDNTPLVHVVVTDNSNNHVVLDDHIQQPPPPPPPTNAAAVVDSGPHFIDVSAPDGGDASVPHLSADGTKMVFDPDGGIFYTDLNITDPLQPGSVTSPISLSDLAQQATDAGYNSFGNPAISADGSYVIFQGNFLTGGHDILVAHKDANGSFCITKITNGFDAKIDGGGFHLVMEQQNGDVALFTRDNNGNWCQQTSICGDAAICNPNISANGHVITFSTAACTITIGDQTFHVGGDGNVETYVYDTRAQNPWDALQVVSVSSDGRIANGDSVGTASLSQDGHYIVFESTARNLDGGAGETNIYLRDTVNHTTTLISRGIDGLPGDGNSFDASINPDGTYVVFTSCASNLVSGDINGALDVFKYDIATGQIAAVSDVINPLGAVDGTVSGGGLYVAYERPGFTFDNQPVPAHIVVEDLSNGQTGIVVEDDNSPSTLTTTGTIDFTGAGTSVQVVNDPINGDLGTLTAAVSNGHVTWTYTVDKSVAAQVADGHEHDDTFTINLGNGSAVTPITVTEVIVGTNETPTIDLAPIVTEVPVPNPLPAGADMAAVQEVAPAMSNDGRWVVFFSDEQIPNGGNNSDKGDVFLYDRLTGVTEVLTDYAHIPLGTTRPAGEHFSGFSISPDGSTVVFKGEYQVVDGNSPTGFDDVSNIYVYNRATDTVHLLTNPADNNNPFTVNDEARIAGGHVVFSSTDFGNINAPPTHHLYVTDFAGHIQTDITLGDIGLTDPPPPINPNDPQTQFEFQQPDISGNGRFLTFWAVENTFNNGVITPAGPATLYTYDRTTGDHQTIATSSGGDGDNWWASMSDDGQRVVFQSDLVPNSSGHTDVFYWDRGTNQITDITALADGNSFRASISANGNEIIFASDADNLVPGDTNGLGDTFVYDVPSNTIKLVSAASDGTQGNGDSTLGADISRGGDFHGAFVAFGSTAGNLVTPHDSDNGQSDIFVVDRTGGILGAVIEDDTTPAFVGAPAGTLSTHGAFNFSDVDLTDAHTIQVIGDPVITAPPGFDVPQGGLGTFTPTLVDSNGTGHGEVAWTFTVDNALVQGLAGFQQFNEVYAIQIDDGHGGVVTQNVTIVIGGTPDAPVARNDTLFNSTQVAFSEGTNTTFSTAVLLANDTDPDNNTTLTIQSVGAAHGGTVTLNNDHTITYAPDESFFGADSFTYTITDGSLTSTATVSFYVAGLTSSVFWQGPSDGDWNVDGNWSSNAVPDSTSDVTIAYDDNFNSGPVVVATTTPIATHSLDLENNSDLKAADISVATDLTVAGGSCGPGSTEISASGHDLTVGLSGIGGNVHVTADATNSDSSAEINSDKTVTIGNVAGNFSVEAISDWGSATADINAGGDLTIGNIGGDFLLSASHTGFSYFTNAHAELIAAGSLTIGDVGGDFAIVGDAGQCSQAHAEISAAGPDLTIGNIAGVFENQDRIEADNGTLSIGAVFGGSFVNSGLMQAGAIDIADPVVSPVFENDGTVQDWGFANSTIGVDVTNYGTFTVGGGPVQDIAGFGITIQGQVTNSHDVQALDGGYIGLRGGLINQSSATLMAAGVATYGLTNTPAEIDITGCVTNAGFIYAGNPQGEGGGAIKFENAQNVQVDNNYGVIAAYGGGGIALINTTVTGGNIEAHGDGSRVFLSDATIIGSNFVADNGFQVSFTTQADGGFSQSILDGSTSAGEVTNGGSFDIADGTDLVLRGEIGNFNSISVGGFDHFGGGRLIIDGHVTLDDGGNVVLQGLGNFIDGLPSNGCDTLDNVDNTIAGDGQIGDPYLTLSNEGLIAATDGEIGVNTIVIDTGTNVVENDGGTIEAITGGQMTIVSDISNDSCGLIQSCGDGSLVMIDGTVWNSALIKASFGGEVDLNGAVDNTGDIVAAIGGTVVLNSLSVDNCGTLEANGGRLEIVNTIGGNGTATFGSNGGTIRIDDIDYFTSAEGTIAGFMAGAAGVAITTIDIANRQFGSTSQPNYYDLWDSNNNILQVTTTGQPGAFFQVNFDGTHTQSDFALRADQNGTVDIISSPATLTFAAGSLDSFGDATEGQQVTALFDATVSGMNVGPVTYTWLDDGNIVLSGIGDNVYTPTHDAGDQLFVVASFIDPIDGATDFISDYAGSVNLAPVQGGTPSPGTWTNVFGGDWFDGGNWFDGIVPPGVSNNADHVVIEEPVGQTVTFDGHGHSDSVVITSLTIGSDVTFAATDTAFVTLLGGDLDNSGTVIADHGTIGVDGDAVNTGTMIAENNGSIDVGDALQAHVFANSGVVVAGNNGAAEFDSVSGAGLLVIDGGGIIIDPFSHLHTTDVADTNDIQFSTAATGSGLFLDGLGQINGHISGFAAAANFGDIANAPFISLGAIGNESAPPPTYTDNGDHSGTLTVTDGSNSIALNFYGDYTAANFSAPYDGLTTLITDVGPVISAADQQVTGDESSTTLSGLQIFDEFANSDNFTITATAGHGTLSLANPDDDPGLVPGSSISATTTLADINTVLGAFQPGHGIVYTPDSPEPVTDMVTVRITDEGGGQTNGAIDELHFIFNVSGQSGATLAGTNGKDVIYGTGNDDTLTGGQSSDTFVFKGFSNGSEPVTGHDTITDFNALQDFLQLDHTVFTSISAILASAQTDAHGNTTIHGADANSTVTLNHVTAAEITQHQDHILMV